MAPVALSAGLAIALAVWDPEVRDLASHTFRSELYERTGFSIWNGTWFGGHYLLTYSVLVPPLAALLGVGLVGAVSVVAGAYLFDRLVRARWGERARLAALWYAAGSVTMLASGRINFAVGVAFGLASLRALQLRRVWVAATAALGCALASPVAALFLAGVALAGAGAGLAARMVPKLAVVAAALAPVGLLYLVFPGAGQEPFSFSAYIAVPLWCLGALYVTRGKLVEREFAIAVAGYLAIGTLVWVVPNGLGGNVTRLGALFGGPVLAAVLLSAGTRRARSPAAAGRFGGAAGPRWASVPSIRAAAVALVLAGSAYWQVQGAVRDVVESLGDPSTKRSYYEPLARWLRAHGGERARIEVVPTFNHWEAAYMAPDFQLARGWLRQLDRDRNELFYEGELTRERYAQWVVGNGIRYVALPDSELDYSGEEERDLIESGFGLRPRAVLAHWRVYEAPNVVFVYGEDESFTLRSEGRKARAPSGEARLRSLGPQSFSLDLPRRGRFVVRVRWTPYWKLDAGDGCLTRAAGDWTLVRADRPGLLRASIGFSPARAGRAATGDNPRC